MIFLARLFDSSELGRRNGTEHFSRGNWLLFLRRLFDSSESKLADEVLELLRRVAAAHPGVLAAPAPLALFLGFGDSALNFELRAWTNRFDRWVVIRSELGVALYAALRDAGMEIPFPQREVRLRQD